MKHWRPLLLVRVLAMTLLALAMPLAASAKPAHRASHAAPAAPVAVASAPQQASPLAAPLQSFMPQPAPIVLRGAQGQESLSLPIAKRLAIRSATLHLVATTSVSLLAARSQLQVRLNGQVIAQIPLDPKLPQIQAEIALPVRLLEPGYATLTFTVAQHYTNECEDPSAPELWTQIDTAQSWIGIDGALRDIHPTLARLSEVFDPKLWGKHRLTIVAPSLDAQVLRWGALAAQAAALYLGYAPLTVRFAAAGSPVAANDEALRLNPALVPRGDAALVGTAGELAPYLSAQLAKQITGPFLAVLPLTKDEPRYVLVASGRTPAEVDTALSTATVLVYPYPQETTAVVRQVELPPLPDDPGPRMVYPNQKVAFERLGFETVSFAGMYGRKELEFSLPADLFAPDNSMVHLKLRFAYGAGLREDSALNVLLNGRFQAAIPLSVRDGGYFRDYDVAIPLTSFQPGRNVITFAASMMPLITGKCLAINTDNLRLTIFGDSWIESPNASRVTSLPNLELLARTGFPYSRKPYGAGVVFALTGNDAQAAAAAWTLAAKLAQVQSLPLIDARWQIGTAGLDAAANAIVVGTAASLPAPLAKVLPLRLGAVSIAPYPVAASPAGPREIGLLDHIGRWLADKFQISTPPVQPLTAWATQTGMGLGQQAALLQAALPGRSGGLLTVLTAGKAETLAAQTDALVHPAVWSQLRGDLLLWEGDKQVASQMVGPRFTMGEAGASARLAYLLSLHPWFWGIVIAVLTLLLAAVTLRLLMRFLHRRHPRTTLPPQDPPSLV
jgi:hypothetical protein